MDWKKPVKLRVKKEEGRSFDLKLQEVGLVHPIAGNVFTGPNGMSLRPEGGAMYEILSETGPKASVREVPEGTAIPEGLVLIHEHTDYYSMQTTAPCSVEDLKRKLDKFLLPFDMFPKASYFKRYPL